MPEKKENAPDKLSIDVPLESFTDTALSNLEKLVASKAPLIKKAIAAEDLPIVQSEDRLCFPWFSAEASADEMDAYSKFICALCEMAKNQKRVTAINKPVASERYAFRVFLLRLGFIGPEFASARKILLANLSGSGSFKGGRSMPNDHNSASESSRDCLACAGSFSEPAENDGEPSRLFCQVRQKYVAEDGCCDEFNS